MQQLSYRLEYLNKPAGGKCTKSFSLYRSLVMRTICEILLKNKRTKTFSSLKLLCGGNTKKRQSSPWISFSFQIRYVPISYFVCLPYSYSYKVLFKLLFSFEVYLEEALSYFSTSKMYTIGYSLELIWKLKEMHVCAIYNVGINNKWTKLWLYLLTLKLILKNNQPKVFLIGSGL